MEEKEQEREAMIYRHGMTIASADSKVDGPPPPDGFSSIPGMTTTTIFHYREQSQHAIERQVTYKCMHHDVSQLF